MPRMARVIVPSLPHHIVQRGHNRNAVFIKLMGKLTSTYQVRAARK